MKCFIPIGKTIARKIGRWSFRVRRHIDGDKIEVWLLGFIGALAIAGPALAFDPVAWDSPQAVWCEPKGFSKVLAPGGHLSLPYIPNDGLHAPQAAGDATQRRATTWLTVDAVDNGPQPAKLALEIGVSNVAPDLMSQSCPLAPWQGDKHANWPGTGDVYSFVGESQLALERIDNLYVGSTCWNMALENGLIDAVGNWTLDPVLPYGNRPNYAMLSADIYNLGTTSVTIKDNETCLESETVRLVP